MVDKSAASGYIPARMKFASNFMNFPAAGALALCGLLFSAAPVSAQDAEPKTLTTETNAVPESKAAPKKTDWARAAHLSTESLLKHFWNSTGRYFNAETGGSTSFNYWPQAHAMDVVIDAWLRTRDSKYSDYFEPWYEGIRKKNGGRYWNVFFDDMEWIALTLLRLHEATGDEKYLNTAQRLWGFIQKGWDPETGGISWKTDHLWSKNACSNGPASILASRLYRTGGDQKDLDWAKKIYAWEKERLFDPETGAITDHYNDRTKSKAGIPLSYNQGTFLGAAYELYKLTGEIQYLRDAEKAASFTITGRSTLDRRNGILRDEGRGDGALFKGIFIRYFVQLMLEKELKPETRAQYRDFLYHNAEVLWTRGVKQEELLFSQAWSHPPEGNALLNAQTSACTLLEALAFYEKSQPETK